MAVSAADKEVSEDGPKARKVTNACDSCRAKRQKCDGETPCRACRELSIDCTYSRQARRRGPPLGFLRHIEVRLHINDAFLGFLLAHLDLTAQQQQPQSASPAAAQSTHPFTPDQNSGRSPHRNVLAEAFRDLLAQVQSFAQPLLSPDQSAPKNAHATSEQTAKWDDYAAQWRDTEVSKILDNVSAKFATPVSRPELESPLRTNTTGTTAPNTTAGTAKNGAKGSSATSPSTVRPSSTAASDLPIVVKEQIPDFYPISLSDPAHGTQHMDMDAPLSLSSQPPLHPPSNFDFLSMQPSSSLEMGAGWTGEQLDLALADLLGDPLATSTTSPSFPQLLQDTRHPSSSLLDFQNTNTGFGPLPPSWMNAPAANHAAPSSHHQLQQYHSSAGAGSSIASGSRSHVTSSSMEPETGSFRAATPTMLSSEAESAAKAVLDEGAAIPTEMDTVRYQGSATGMHHQALESSYMGSFWSVPSQNEISADG
ncbi:hypothetical protein DL93DRAFT_800390 [Clavulina sp. PMI_390]|nr:hypothetical protein DL93DRAFT_800390 [Clavulina sp. PMI_390]